MDNPTKGIHYSAMSFTEHALFRSGFPDPFPLPGTLPQPEQKHLPPWRILTGSFTVSKQYAVLRTTPIREHILLATSGGAGLVAMPSGWTEARPGTLVLIKPGTAHYYATRQDQGHWSFVWAHFFPRQHWTWTELRNRPFAGLRISACQSERQQGEVFDALSKMHRRWLAGSNLNEELALNALEEALLLAAPASPGETVTDKRIQSCLDHVISDPSKPHCVNSLAKRANLSPSRFAHLFRQQTGRSPQAFIEQVRLDLAASSFVAGGQTVSEIADSLGFSSPFYLSRRFKNRFGVSPSLYRTQAHLQRSSESSKAV